jgi:hypothetical protein
MSDDLDEIDAALRRAMAALDGEAPAGYFEALPARTLARLDDPAIGELPDEPGRKPRREPASEPPVQPLRGAQGRPPADDEDEVFSSQIMAAVELPEPAEPAAPGAPWRDARAASSSMMMALPMLVPSDPAADAAGARSPGAAAPSSTASAGPVEAPASAAASMAAAGSPGRRRSRRVGAAILGIGAIGLAAVAVIYLAGGDHAPRSAPSAVSREHAAPISAPAGSPSVGGGSSVASASAGSAASAGPDAGSGVAPDAASHPVPEPVGKFSGSAGKRPGNAKTAIKGGGKPPAPGRTPLSGDDIERAMAAVAGKARACLAGTGGAASLRLTVAPSGRIARVVATGPHAGTPAGACLERAVRAATFPPRSGGPQSFDYSYPAPD